MDILRKDKFLTLSDSRILIPPIVQSIVYYCEPAVWANQCMWIELSQLHRARKRNNHTVWIII